MVDGVLTLEVRAALLFLFMRRLGLYRHDGLVEVANREEVERVLVKMSGRYRQ